MSGVVSPARDVRVDVLRGLALVTIFVNHVPGNAFGGMTTRNIGFSDAAEVFVLLAGFSAAYAYDRKFVDGNRIAVVLKAWRRAGALYLWHIATTFAAIAILAYAVEIFARPGYLLDTVPGLYLNVSTLAGEPWRGLVGLLTGAHQLGYFNILPMYGVLLLGLPAIMLAARLGLRALLVMSFGLWLAAGQFDLNMPNYPTPGGWYFNPFAWQVLFVIGFALAVHRREGGEVPFIGPLYAVALLYVLFSFFIVRSHMWYLLPELPLPERLAKYDKGFVALPRLLHVLALGYVVMMCPVGAWMKRIGTANPLAVMGRNSLPVFALGALLALLSCIARTEIGGGLLVDCVLIGGGLAALYAIAVAAERSRPAPELAPRHVRTR